MRAAMKEMCRAAYRAEQVKRVVVVFATGHHHTAGYQVSFERVGVTVFPPQFSFMHERPEKQMEKSLTPFAGYVMFEADRRVDAIVVYDATGRHTVDVVQVGEEDRIGIVV